MFDRALRGSGLDARRRVAIPHTRRTFCIISQFLTQDRDLTRIRRVAASPSVPSDDPLRALLPVAIPSFLLFALGAFHPLIAAVALALALIAATGVAAYLIIRLVRKFIHENASKGGVLEAWRPTIGEGVLTAVSVLLRWAPFGFLSLLVFGANGLLVEWIARLLELGIHSVRDRTSELGQEVGGLQGTVASFLGVDGVLESCQSGLSGTADFLANLLMLLRLLLVIEGFIAWMFLIWLTVRSVLYFLARSVLAEKLRKQQPTNAPIEVRFDMEFVR